jgi:hypothetical protein
MTIDPCAFPARSGDAISAQQAFQAMVVFLEAFWTRDGRPDDSMAKLLSWTYGALAGDGPGDPAMWEDWLDAIDAAARRGS